MKFLSIIVTMASFFLPFSAIAKPDYETTVRYISENSSIHSSRSRYDRVVSVEFPKRCFLRRRDAQERRKGFFADKSRYPKEKVMSEHIESVHIGDIDHVQYGRKGVRIYTSNTDGNNGEIFIEVDKKPRKEISRRLANAIARLRDLCPSAKSDPFK